MRLELFSPHCHYGPCSGRSKDSQRLQLAIIQSKKNVRTRAFLIRVEWNGPLETRPDARDTVVNRDGVRVVLSNDSLFAFCYRARDRVVAGEAIGEVSRADALRAADALFDGASADALPATALGLVAIDFRRRRVLLTSTIANTRAYYYSALRDQLVVATHLGALRDAGVPFEADPDVLPEFCSYRTVIPPRTLVKDVRRCVGGRTLVWPLRGSATPDVRPWHPPERRDPAGAVDGVEERLDRFLAETACAPRATLLSGGLDSSLIAMREQAREPRSTALATGFAWADPGDRETDYARGVAGWLGVPLQCVATDPASFLGGIVDTIRDTGEPVDHLQAVMLHLLFRRHAGAGPLLCGQMADGLLGKDLHWKLYRRRHPIALLQRTGGTRVIRAAGPGGRLRFFGQQFGRDHESPDHLLWSIGRYIRPALVRDVLGCSDDSMVDGFRRLMEPYRRLDLLDRVTLAVLLSDGPATMVPWMLAAEAHDIPLLFPYADPGLVRHLFSVPWAVKLQEPKFLVRSLLRRNGYPARFLTRPKLSFGFGPQAWAPEGAMFQPLVDMAAAEYGAPLLRRLQRVDGTRPMLLWSLLNLWLWRRLFLDGADADDLKAEISGRAEARS